MLGQFSTAQRFVPQTASPDAPASSTFVVPLNGRPRMDAIAMAVDGQGSIYITGTVATPVLPGVTPQIPNKGSNAFVAKFDSRGRPLWLTYVGGTNRAGGTIADPGREYPFDIAVDPSGQAVIVGRTASNDFPVVNAFQEAAPRSQLFNGFVAKLSSDGKRIIYASYFGSPSADSRLSAVAVGPAGEAWVVGSSSRREISTQFDVSNTDSNQIVVIKLNPAGGVVWSTRMSGDTVEGLAVDGAGQSYVAASCYQGRACNSFVSKLSTSGSQQLYRERVGYGNASRLNVNSRGEIVVTGTGAQEPTVAPWPATWAMGGFGYVRVVEPSGHVLSMNNVPGNTVLAASDDRLIIGFNTLTGSLQTERGLVTHHTDGPIFASDNFGGTWTNLGGPAAARSMVIDPHRDVLYVGGNDNSLHRSDDGGMTWMPDGSAQRFAIDPRDPAIQWSGSYGRTFSGGTLSIARRVNGGPWEGVGIATLVTALGVSPHDGSVWAGTENAGIEVISDQGRTARFEGEGFPPRSAPPSPPNVFPAVKALAFDPVDSEVVYAAFASGLYARLGSAQWVPVTSELPRGANTGLQAVAVDRIDPNALFVGRGDGLYRSADRGRTWQAVLPERSIVSIVQDPIRPAVMFASGDVIYRSVDRGVTWERASSGYESRVAPGELAMSARTSRLYVSSGSLQTVPFVMDLASSGSQYTRSWATYLQSGTLFDIATVPAGNTVVGLITAFGERSELTIVQIGR
jgi:hypothetical protein